MNICMVLSTAPSQESAQEIADRLIEQRAAACVQINPGLLSVYRWQGKIVRDSEWQIVIKTTSENVTRAYQLLCDAHPYEVPQWVVFDKLDASSDYAEWVKEQTN